MGSYVASGPALGLPGARLRIADEQAKEKHGWERSDQEFKQNVENPARERAIAYEENTVRPLNAVKMDREVTALDQGVAAGERAATRDTRALADETAQRKGVDAAMEEAGTSLSDQAKKETLLKIEQAGWTQDMARDTMVAKRVMQIVATGSSPESIAAAFQNFSTHTSFAKGEEGNTRLIKQPDGVLAIVEDNTIVAQGRDVNELRDAVMDRIDEIMNPENYIALKQAAKVKARERQHDIDKIDRKGGQDRLTKALEIEGDLKVEDVKQGGNKAKLEKLGKTMAQTTKMLQQRGGDLGNIVINMEALESMSAGEADTWLARVKKVAANSKDATEKRAAQTYIAAAEQYIELSGKDMGLKASPAAAGHNYEAFRSKPKPAVGMNTTDAARQALGIPVEEEEKGRKPRTKLIQ